MEAIAADCTSLKQSICIVFDRSLSSPLSGTSAPSEATHSGPVIRSAEGFENGNEKGLPGSSCPRVRCCSGVLERARSLESAHMDIAAGAGFVCRGAECALTSCENVP